MLSRTSFACSHQPALCAQHTSTSRARARLDVRCTLSLPSAVKYSIVEARSAAELRAAAYLRAYSFYSYPPDRSEYSARAHRRMKGDAEWGSLQAKLDGTEKGWQDVVVNCFVAVIDDDPDAEVAQQVTQVMDLSAKLPATHEGQPAQLVVGSLDVNRGTALPAEELQGSLPQEGARHLRAYFSNVCVAAPMRRQGVAAALMSWGERFARGSGVQYMYVHVVADNTPALQLYLSLGYEVEAEEDEAMARALQRPRRKLLRKKLA